MFLAETSTPYHHDMMFVSFNTLPTDTTVGTANRFAIILHRVAHRGASPVHHAANTMNTLLSCQHWHATNRTPGSVTSSSFSDQRVSPCNQRKTGTTLVNNANHDHSTATEHRCPSSVA